MQINYQCMYSVCLCKIHTNVHTDGQSHILKWFHVNYILQVGTYNGLCRTSHLPKKELNKKSVANSFAIHMINDNINCCRFSLNCHFGHDRRARRSFCSVLGWRIQDLFYGGMRWPTHDYM